ncbi:MAG TPA: hypothetical protein VFB27_09970 [Opitutaceae bacterium]|nr:hypothetical protein [Opitutaceae bacterium]
MSDPSPAASADTTLEQYKLYLKDLQKVGDRHERTRKYYLSLITALFTVLSLGQSGAVFKLADGTVWLVAAFGALLCALWAAHMVSYHALYGAKFALLKQLEEKLSCQLFKMEKEKLGASRPGYFSMTGIDALVAMIFIGLFLALPFLDLASK